MIAQKKLLLIGHARDVVNAMQPHIGAEDIVFATADTVAHARELLETERYNAVIFDLEQEASSFDDLADAIATATSNPGLILIADQGSRKFYDSNEAALSLSLNVLAQVARPVTASAILEALTGIATTTSGGADADTVLSEPEFLRGLVSDGLAPIFQPKLDIKQAKLVEAEVFARWKAPSGGLLGAGAIIKMARAQGHMTVLTYRMLELALAEQAKWSREGQSLPIGVNIAFETLYEEDFLDVVTGLAEQYGVAPSSLRLELTEAEMDGGLEKPFAMLEKLKKAGFGLALDDFGTGFATLLDVPSIPFDEIIIDRRFVASATTEKRARIILESAINLAKQLGLRVTCEGVETEEQLRLIADLGADCAQGYLIGKPMSPHEFLIWAEDLSAGVVKIPGVYER